LTSGQAFVAMHRLLDSGATGPLYLRMPEIAVVAVEALKAGERDLGRYELHSFVVMPNHVHALVTPNVYATKWLGPLKGFTAYQANRILGLKGEPFWQPEGYDHLVRSPEEFRRIQRYIENNPVSAGLASCPENFLWSSAPAMAAAAKIG
jgi:REP element-mobilizing transposase RayT